MTRVDFYFDPACPYAWLTSLWIRDVRRQRDIDIEWKFFSLAEINGRDPQYNWPLQVAALARREGGNGAVDRAYLALGRAIHERKAGPRNPEAFLELAPEELVKIGLDGSLVSRAIEDETTVTDVLEEHRRIVESKSAFGVPWIVLENGDFFGPVIGEFVRGDDALRLWDNFTWAAAQPYLYELKRGRAPLPGLQGLSEELEVREPVGA